MDGTQQKKRSAVRFENHQLMRSGEMLTFARRVAEEVIDAKPEIGKIGKQTIETTVGTFAPTNRKFGA